MNRFQGKVVLVTGAVSGMGRASCIRFVAEGASVFGIDIDEKGYGNRLKLLIQLAARWKPLFVMLQAENVVLMWFPVP